MRKIKKLILFLLLLPNFIYSQNKNFYVEGNVGLSTTAIETGIDPTYVTMTYDKSVVPNVSVLLGNVFPMGGYSLVDIQIGLCYPYIVTGKVGAGSYYGKKDQIALILGVRPYPLSAYGQLNIGQKNRSHLIISGELGSGGQIFKGTTSLFNIGLRVPIE